MRKMFHKHEFTYGWVNYRSDTRILTATVRFCKNCNKYQEGLYYRIFGLKIFFDIKGKEIKSNH